MIDQKIIKVVDQVELNVNIDVDVSMVIEYRYSRGLRPLVVVMAKISFTQFITSVLVCPLTNVYHTLINS